MKTHLRKHPLMVVPVVMLLGLLGFLAAEPAGATVQEEGTWRWVDAFGHCAAECQNPPWHCPCWEAPIIIVKG